MDYIVGIVQESLHIIPAGAVTGKLDEFATCLSCRGASIREAGVSLLRICERRTRPLLLRVRGGFRHGSIDIYLVRYPGVRVRYTIQNHMSDALHKFSTQYFAFEHGEAYTSGNTRTTRFQSNDTMKRSVEGSYC